MRAPVLLGVLLAAATLAGCGSTASSSATTSATAHPFTTQAKARAAHKRIAAKRRAVTPRPPKGASPVLRAIYAAFPPPSPDPALAGSRAAVRAGERACAGRTPTQVKDEFYAAAAPNLAPEQKRMVARIASLENPHPGDAAFTTGQLAADVYAATLRAGIGQYGYRGCVYSLARRLEGELAPRPRTGR